MCKYIAQLYVYDSMYWYTGSTYAAWVIVHIHLFRPKLNSDLKQKHVLYDLLNKYDCGGRYSISPFDRNDEVRTLNADKKQADDKVICMWKT